MWIQIVSDLHAEWAPSYAIFQEFANSLYVPEVDILIVAGDLGPPYVRPWALNALQEAGYKKIYYVPGNHEFYSNRYYTEELELMRTECETLGVDLLYNDTLEIDGHRFHGTTLWFRDDPPWNEILMKNFSDFRYIKEFEKWVYKENAKAIKFLEDEVKQGDIVITHHLPAPQSQHPKWESSEKNRWFLCDMRELIFNQKPKLWIHGHTHDSMDYKLEDTRIICNPNGYWPDMLNPEFIFNKLIQL